MASLEAPNSDVSLQGDLEDLKMKLKVWESIINAGAPRIQHETTTEALFEQCATLGSIFEQIPEYQVRLLALQLTGHLPGFVFAENASFLNSLSGVSMKWRELYLRLSRWHAQVQTTFLRPDGFLKHCNDIELLLQKFGDQIYDIQQKFYCGFQNANEKNIQHEMLRLYDLQKRYTKRMQNFKMCLVAMHYCTTTALREKQLRNCDKKFADLEAFLDVEERRLAQCFKKFGMMDISSGKHFLHPPNEFQLINMFTDSPDESLQQSSSKHKLDLSREQGLDILESKGEVPEQNTPSVTPPPLPVDPAPARATDTVPPKVTDIAPPRATATVAPRATDIGPPRATDIGPPRVTDTVPPKATDTAPRVLRRKDSRSFLSAVFLATLPIDFIFLCLLVALLCCWCNTYDHIVFARSWDNWGLSWSKMWSNTPPI